MNNFRSSALLSFFLLALLAGLPCWRVAPIALAVTEPQELLADPRLENEAERIGAQLRCLVCQNESIEESEAPLARDLRRAVREQLREGRSEKQIMAWMQARYGDFIRLTPPFSRLTALLWATPLLALMGGLFLARRFWTRPAEPPTLDPLAEQDDGD
ncbi:cytochrome c-type biogenesis protein [Oecophyllibacter saccharovorans]|uniref:Cytochrome c-type biogenesis protein n=1 Tax=Oecophyllibacter saccharovorans TaxID=2558360 RepID=A0A506UML2_9PROT|nr:cytochrome c-type biogenesis protein CcmH [Oecophyllibacter saccharovorans]